MTTRKQVYQQLTIDKQGMDQAIVILKERIQFQQDGTLKCEHSNCRDAAYNKFTSYEELLKHCLDAVSSHKAYNEYILKIQYESANHAKRKPRKRKKKTSEKIQRSIEKELNKSDFEKCEKILEHVEAKFGYNEETEWWLEQLQEEHEQKKYLIDKRNELEFYCEICKTNRKPFWDSLALKSYDEGEISKEEAIQKVKDAHIRHSHSDYDNERKRIAKELVKQGWDYVDAMEFACEEVRKNLYRRHYC